MRGGARFPLFVLLLVFTFVLYEHAVRRLKAAESAPGPLGLTFPVSRADPEALFTVKLMSQCEASRRSVFKPKSGCLDLLSLTARQWSNQDT